MEAKPMSYIRHQSTRGHDLFSFVSEFSSAWTRRAELRGGRGVRFTSYVVARPCEPFCFTGPFNYFQQRWVFYATKIYPFWISVLSQAPLWSSWTKCGKTVSPSVGSSLTLNVFLACQHVHVRSKCGLKCVPQQTRSDGSHQDRIRSEFIFDFSVYCSLFWPV